MGPKCGPEWRPCHSTGQELSNCPLSVWLIQGGGQAWPHMWEPGARWHLGSWEQEMIQLTKGKCHKENTSVCVLKSEMAGTFRSLASDGKTQSLGEVTFRLALDYVSSDPTILGNLTASDKRCQMNFMKLITSAPHYHSSQHMLNYYQRQGFFKNGLFSKSIKFKC